MLDREHEYQKMAECERDHWWYRSLHEQCLHAIAGMRAEQPLNILDAACGTGGLLLKLLRNCGDQLYGFDLSPLAVERAQARGLNVVQADLRSLSGVFPLTFFDVIVSNDSLYFLSECEQNVFVRACHERLRPGGLLIMNLPARREFSGAHDQAVGIARRFETKDVARLVQTGPWILVRNKSWPMFLSPLVLAVRTIQRLRMRFSPPDTVVSSDVDMPSRGLNAFLHGLTSVERFWPGHGYGSSILLVMRKPARN